MTAAEFAARWGGHVPGPMGVRRRFAVLIPLVEAPDGLRLLFEVRAAGLRQGGEVCFPGGRAEQDESALDCALRETREELSIPREEIRVLGMTDYLLHQRGFLLQPVVGLVSPVGMAALSPSPAEVAEVFTPPLSFFRNRTTPITTAAASTRAMIRRMRRFFFLLIFGFPPPAAAGAAAVCAAVCSGARSMTSAISILLFAQMLFRPLPVLFAHSIA